VSATSFSNSSAYEVIQAGTASRLGLRRNVHATAAPRSGPAKLRCQARLETLLTPDGRYMVVRGRLWRAANPHLPAAEREALVRALMTARRAVKAASAAKDRDGLAAARRSVDAAKVALGERGPVWWHDGAKDFNRHLAKNTPYRDWYNQVSGPQA
jgi:hypothetical protein